jgi:hypothetical protein
MVKTVNSTSRLPSYQRIGRIAAGWQMALEKAKNFGGREHCQ